MEQAEAFRGKFDLQFYNNLQASLDAAQCQRTILDFMALVRDDAFDSLGGGQLVKDFCGLVNHKDVWHLAEMVVPEFRMSKAEKSVSVFAP